MKGFSTQLVLVVGLLAFASLGAIAGDAPSAQAMDAQTDTMQCFACVTMMSALQMDVKAKGPQVMYGRLSKACPNVPSEYRPMCDKLIGFLSKMGGPMALGFIGMVPADLACTQILPFCSQCHLNANAANSPIGPLLAMFTGGMKNLRGVLQPGSAHPLNSQGEIDQASVDLEEGGAGSAPKKCSPMVEGGCDETVDEDKDDFSPTKKSARGVDWRGRDCNDKDKNVYPGVAVDSGDVDSNCNGIHGTGKEEKLCKDSGSMGVVNFGDSLSAGFHIHGKWLRLDDMSLLRTSFNQELDEPQRSWVTGFAKDSSSIYSIMRERNLCNHRDYQNLAFNGARMRDFPGQVAKLARTPADKPILAFVAYVGNDVCGKHGDMTESADFQKDLQAGLVALDAKVAPGSKVVLVGLADGTFLADTMGDEMHPIGVPYPQLYKFMSCTGMNMCPNWLTSDDDKLQSAKERGQELNEVLSTVSQRKDSGLKNIELVYSEFPLQEALNDAQESLGLAPVELINPVDGFHPQLQGDSLLAKKMADILDKTAPGFLGKVNPHNKEILESFGEQGGH